MPINRKTVRPEDNYNERLTVTQGGPNPGQFIDVPNNNGIFGGSALPSQVSLAANLYGVPPMRWNLGGKRQVFTSPAISDGLNNRVQPKVPFTPIRTFYAVPTPRIGLGAVTSALSIGGTTSSS